MRILISPAKKMKVDTDSFAPNTPGFLGEAREILGTLRTMDGAALQRLWQCNDGIANQNLRRLAVMELDRNLTPAILAYEGIQYQYMAPTVFEATHFSFVEAHLRIVSGLYGLLRPMDGVSPYRLEMQARLSVGGYKNLYDFWGTKLADQLMKETDFVVNLASKEYSKGILPHLKPTVQVLTCHFTERKGEKLVEKATMCKMARGQMVRFLAETRGTTPAQIQAFDQLNFRFSPQDSTEQDYYFIKGD